MKRKPGSAAAPKAPVKGYLGGSGADAVAEVSFYVSSRERTSAEQRAVRDAKRSIRRAIRKGRLSAAMKTLSAAIKANTFDAVEIAQARASIAKGYFVFGKDTTALRLARLAADAAGDRVPEAHWTAGMAAWRLGKLEEATGHFEQVSLSERATSRARSWRVLGVAGSPADPKAGRCHTMAGPRGTVSADLLRVVGAPCARCRNPVRLVSAALDRRALGATDGL